MSPLLRCFPLAALLATSVGVGAQSTGVLTGVVTGVVTGRLLCADTHTPCRFATVVLETAPPRPSSSAQPQPIGPTHSYSASSDLHGAFRIAGVLPGDYYVQGEMEGYLSPYDLAADTADDAHATDTALNRITVEASQSTAVSLTLVRGASLSGTVHYDDGGPGIRLAYHLYRRNAAGKWQPYTNHPGDPNLAPLGLQAHTDDRGRFREPALPPGVYTRRGGAAGSNPGTRLTQRTSRAHDAGARGGDALLTFYGNGHRLSEASPLELREGEDRTDVDFTIPVNGLHTVEGIVQTGVNGRPVSQGTVHLLDPADQTVLREAPLKNDGLFRFRYVPAGSYLLKIEPEGPYSNRLKLLTAPLQVESDVSGLLYALAPPQTAVSGRLAQQLKRHLTGGVFGYLQASLLTLPVHQVAQGCR